LASTQHEFGRVQDLYLPVGLAVLVIVVGAFAFAVVRYRARPGRAPRPTRDRNVLEAAIATVIAGIVAVLLVTTLRANADITDTGRHGRPGFAVDVLTFRWGWQFSYPSLPGVVDRTRPNAPPVLHVPADTMVRFRMRTEDVVHAFWVPAVRFKADAWPDTTRTFDLVFGEGQAVSGHCAQYCGLKHSDMVFTVDAMAPADFRAWAARMRPRAAGGRASRSERGAGRSAEGTLR
jgi:cytochrome c oxidase subunit II